ncbi:hypothetical protein [Noviherbaspirillum soli]|uniref:hypothetical protein n=1 Tax=Noviherbaspirillum soli TaxID=1064518 RepID=UPI00188B7D28|nr:hypothetical protein [Noviherbaspirillum soli]
MTKSGTFGDDADAMASQHGEFLAGVLAMARISRVTVALESGTDAGPSLLEAARLTGHAETCLLFEDWEDQPLAALLACAAQATGDGEPGSLPEAGSQAQALQQLLHQAQGRQRRSFLLILNRMERLLARPTHDPHYQIFEQALVALAGDRALDLHLLLVLDESAEFLLTRLEHRMPGIGDGCLRIPPPGQPAPGAEAGRMGRHELPAQGAAAATGSASRDRSFGMLLERLTAKVPLEQAGDDGQALHRHRPDHPTAGLHDNDAGIASAEAAVPQPAADDAAADLLTPAPAAFAAAAETPDAPHSPDPDRQEEPEHQSSGQETLGQHSHAAQITSASAPTSAAAMAVPDLQPAAPARRRRTWPLALGLLLAAGAGMLAWQGLPVSDRGSAGPAQAAAPAVASQPQSAPAADDKVALASQPAAGAPAAPASSDIPPQPATPSGPDKQASAAAPDKAASATAPAAAAATTASTPAVVYVHVRDARERDQVQAQRRALGAQGIRLMEVKVTGKGPSVADLRYFHDEDRDEALVVQKALLAAGVPVSRLSRMNGYEGSTRRRQYEAWLASPAQPSQARR